MTLTEITNLLTLVALAAGLYFGLMEIRQARRSRKRESALQLYETFHNWEFSRAVVWLFELPNKEYGAEEVRQELGEDQEYIGLLGTSFEGLGILMKNREISLDIVEEYFGGAVHLYWLRFRKYFVDVRESSGRETFGEYVQWLAERLMEREAKTGVRPAHIEFADWQE